MHRALATAALPCSATPTVDAGSLVADKLGRVRREMPNSIATRTRSHGAEGVRQAYPIDVWSHMYRIVIFTQIHNLISIRGRCAGVIIHHARARNRAGETCFFCSCERCPQRIRAHTGRLRIVWMCLRIEEAFAPGRNHDTAPASNSRGRLGR